MKCQILAHKYADKLTEDILSEFAVSTQIGTICWKESIVGKRQAKSKK